MVLHEPLVTQPPQQQSCMHVGHSCCGCSNCERSVWFMLLGSNMTGGCCTAGRFVFVCTIQWRLEAGLTAVMAVGVVCGVGALAA